VSETRESRGKKPGREKARKREVRGSSLVDWPVYPRLRRTMRASTQTRTSSSTNGIGLIKFILPKLSPRLGSAAGFISTRSGHLCGPGLLRGGSRRRAIALQRARRISSSTAQRTSIRFGSYTWNMQGALLP
jgi:hypothetical protein